MHRLKAWESYLEHVDFVPRSKLKRFGPSQVVLWDTFGELTLLYRVASAVFVGGSLAPLGGQNFLEPLSYGLIPCIGPSWSNFFWVGEGIFTLGLARQAQNALEIENALLEQLSRPVARSKVKAKLDEYLKPFRGGTEIAVNYLNEALL
jgi:3-deoxy-D-manno-octulosonic-acid transferase